MSKHWGLLSLMAGLAPLLTQGQTVNLRGRVLDKVGMQPVAEATVKLTGSDLIVRTDAAGRFTLKGSSTALAVPNAAPRSFRVTGGAVEIRGARAGESVRLELIGIDGRVLTEAAHILSNQNGGATASARVPTPPIPADFLGFLRITTEEGTLLTRILSLGGSIQPGAFLRPLYAHTDARKDADKDADRATGTADPSSRAAAAKHSSGSAAGNASEAVFEISVAKERLVAKSVTATTADMDVGDIVLDYPPRVLGLGSPPIYGADVLFPASGDSATVQAAFEALWIHKMNSWRSAQGLGTTPVLWKVFPDPASTPGNWKPSLLPCCAPRNGSPEWGYDDIITKKQYHDYQLHLEFNLMGASNGNTDTAGWCNSGVYLTGSQELQIQTPDPRSATQEYWRMHDLATLINEKLPDRNMHLGPGKWQSYDITWRAPRNSPGKVTVYWNGERIHNNVNWGSGAGNPVGFSLQNEKGTDVRFRNVWIKELDIKDAQTDFGY